MWKYISGVLKLLMRKRTKKPEELPVIRENTRGRGKLLGE